MSNVADTTSRVVPGMSETIARLEPTILLNNDDLPTFVSPTSAILKPPRIARAAA